MILSDSVVALSKTESRFVDKNNLIRPIKTVKTVCCGVEGRGVTKQDKDFFQWLEIRKVLWTAELSLDAVNSPFFKLGNSKRWIKLNLGLLSILETLTCKYHKDLHKVAKSPKDLKSTLNIVFQPLRGAGLDFRGDSTGSWRPEARRNRLPCQLPTLQALSIGVVRDATTLHYRPCHQMDGRPSHDACRWRQDLAAAPKDHTTTQLLLSSYRPPILGVGLSDLAAFTLD